MRRLINILKFTPAGLCVLLVIAWIGSFFVHPVVTFPVGSGGGKVIFENATVNYLYQCDAYFMETPLKSGWSFAPHEPDEEHPGPRLFGDFYWRNGYNANFWHPLYARLLLPIPLFILLIIPFAVAPLNRFRLPLWSWFAWTALLAGALTFYLNTLRVPL